MQLFLDSTIQTVSWYYTDHACMLLRNSSQHCSCQQSKSWKGSSCHHRLSSARPASEELSRRWKLDYDGQNLNKGVLYAIAHARVCMPLCYFGSFWKPLSAFIFAWPSLWPTAGVAEHRWMTGWPQDKWVIISPTQREYIHHTMQSSFMQATPGGPLSPSSLFAFDGDSSDDLFR